jgi:hypothetical protein
MDHHTKQHTDLHVSVSCTQTVTQELQIPDCDEEDVEHGCSLTPNHYLGTVLMVLANFSDEELSLTKATVIAVAHEVSQNLIVSINE